MNETVQTLRRKGYRVSVFHNRATTKDNIAQRGGSTDVFIYEKDRETLLSKGSARCSDKDNYDKKMGVRIALGRALDKLQISL